jgi:glycosyltransferase involved in cell wall biosynthesis
MRRKRISIVTPCFNEQDNVRECRLAVRRLFEGQLADYDHEHLFCDNASTDDTAGVLRDLAREDPRVKVILNARNVGPFRSAFHGIRNTSGDAVLLLLPADLQDPAELLVRFVQLWEQGYQVVYGVRKRREEGALMRLTRRAYYRAVSALADHPVPLDAGEFQLVDRRVIDVLRRCHDHYPYVRGLVASCGFRSVGVGYVWRKRARGLSRNRLGDLVDQGLNGLVSTARAPLRFCLPAGLGVSALGAGYALFALLRDGRLSEVGVLTAALFFFAGVQVFFAGVLGEYLSAIHAQVRRRPLVVERGRLNFDAGDDFPVEPSSFSDSSLSFPDEAA